ncbi:hypothetical protein RCL1_004761 [Eukaryota sp. TZLM3-RCL]
MLNNVVFSLKVNVPSNYKVFVTGTFLDNWKGRLQLLPRSSNFFTVSTSISTFPFEFKFLLSDGQSDIWEECENHKFSCSGEVRLLWMKPEKFKVSEQMYSLDPPTRGVSSSATFNSSPFDLFWDLRTTMPDTLDYELTTELGPPLRFHKTLLLSLSPYFRTRLTLQNECEQSLFEFDRFGFTYDNYHDFLLFVYGQNVTIDGSNCYQLYRLAYEFQLTQLREDCRQCLEKNKKDAKFLLSMVAAAEMASDSLFLFKELSPHLMLTEKLSLMDPVPLSLPTIEHILALESLSTEFFLWITKCLQFIAINRLADFDITEFGRLLLKLPVTIVRPTYWYRVFCKSLLEEEDLKEVMTEFAVRKILPWINDYFDKPGFKFALPKIDNEVAVDSIKMKESKVLMICPEFTPNIAGGLGVASEQIVRNLAPHVKLSLVVPEKEATTSGQLKAVLDTKHVPTVLPLNCYCYYYQSNYLQSPLSVYYLSPYGASHFLTSSSSCGSSNWIFTAVTSFNRACVDAVATQVYDVIHCHDWISIEAGIELKNKMEAKLVFHVHSLEVDRNPTQKFEKVFEIESKGFQAADKIIVVSDFTRSKLLSCYPHAEPSKIHVVHNGTDVSSFKNIPTNIPGFTKPSNKKVILFLGRLAEMKGLNYFIKIANEAEKKRPGAFFFLVVGDGDHKNWAINQVKQLNLQDSFHFTGMLERQLAMAAFKLADVFLMTSINEPFGLVALEAVLMNCPVVLSSMSGVLEVLPCALSAHHTDVSSWVKHIEFLVDNPLLCEKYLTGLKSEAQECRWDRSCESLLNIYGSLLN